MLYKYFIRPILFRLNPETAHRLTFSLLRILRRTQPIRALIRALYRKEYPSLRREVFGIDFPNPVGLAAGLDKNGELYNPLSDFGFGFIEIGSLTPLPQDGNPRPRLFRLPRDKAIINRMGINNKGIKHAISQLQRHPPRILVAASLAKNTVSTSDEDTLHDYVSAFSSIYDFVDFFVLNVSCPNVEGMSDLQDISYLSDILDELLSLRLCYDVSKPILVKVSPDIEREQLDGILEYTRLSGIDGIVATNTTRSREGLQTPQERIEEIGRGGLSGAPLFEKSLATVRYIHEKTQGRLPIIGVGGIMTPEQARQMLEAGASLIEVYTGFIYEGPAFVKRILKHLENSEKK